MEEIIVTRAFVAVLAVGWVAAFGMLSLICAVGRWPERRRVAHAAVCIVTTVLVTLLLWYARLSWWMISVMPLTMLALTWRDNRKMKS